MGATDKENTRKRKEAQNDALKLTVTNVQLLKAEEKPVGSTNEVLQTVHHRDNQSIPALIEGQPLHTENQKIRVIVSRQDNSKMVAFMMRKSDPMKKVFDRYSNLIGIQPSSLRFLFDGYTVNHSDTPNSLKMEDSDVMEAYRLAFSGEKCHFKLLSEK